MSKINLQKTATHPQRNRKYCQFNKDQYRIRDIRTGTSVFEAEICRKLQEKSFAKLHIRLFGSTPTLCKSLLGHAYTQIQRKTILSPSSLNH